MADRKISDLTALTTPATGDLIPIVDISEAAAADKNKSITVGELLRGAPDGTAAAPGIAFESDGGNGMFLGGTDILAFSTGGSQAVTIDASQRVGIGTSAPGYKLDVNGEVAFSPNTAGKNTFYFTTNASNDASLFLKSNTTDKVNIQANGNSYFNGGNVGIGTTNPTQLLEINGASTPGVQIKDTTNNVIARLGADDNVAKVGSRSAHPLQFQINDAEVARLDASGRLLVGTSSATNAAPLQVSASDSGAWAAQLRMRDSSNDYCYVNISDNSGSESIANIWSQRTAASTGILAFETNDGSANPTERMRITSGGTVCINTVNTQTARFSIEGSSQALYNAVFHDTRPGSTGTSTSILFKRDTAVVGGISTTSTSTVFNTSSDYRLKENIVPLTGAADRLNQLQVRRFNFIADPDTTVDGFIAHEAQAVVPECVTGTKDEVDENGDPVYQGIDQSKLVPLLTAALQEALQKIETLEQRLNDAGIA